MKTCQICSLRPRATGLVCLECFLHVLADLDSLGRSWALTAEPRGLSQPVKEGGRSSERSLPGGTAWISWREGSDIRHPLNAWISVIRAQESLLSPRDRSIPGLIAWVREHLAAGARHSSIGSFGEQVGKLATKGRTLDGSVEQRGQRIPCQVHACTGILFVDLADFKAISTCRVCGRGWSAPELLAIARMSEAWVSADSAATVADVTPRTLKNWASKGKILARDGQYWLPSVRNAIKS